MARVFIFPQQKKNIFLLKSGYFRIRELQTKLTTYFICLWADRSVFNCNIDILFSNSNAFLRTVECSCIQKSLCRSAWILFQIDTLLDCCQFPSRGSMITGNGGLNIEAWMLLNFVTQKQGINLFFFDYLLILNDGYLL